MGITIGFAIADYDYGSAVDYGSAAKMSLRVQPITLPETEAPPPAEQLPPAGPLVEKPTVVTSYGVTGKGDNTVNKETLVYDGGNTIAKVLAFLFFGASFVICWIECCGTGK